MFGGVVVAFALPGVAMRVDGIITRPSFEVASVLVVVVGHGWPGFEGSTAALGAGVVAEGGRGVEMCEGVRANFDGDEWGRISQHDRCSNNEQEVSHAWMAYVDILL